MRTKMNHLLRTADFTELEAALRAADGHLEMGAPEAVSYTHLDVYKRQVPNSSCTRATCSGARMLNSYSTPLGRCLCRISPLSLIHI